MDSSATNDSSQHKRTSSSLFDDKYLQVWDGGDGRKRILLQQPLLVQKLSGSAVERRLEETIVQNIRQRLSQRHQNPLLTGPNWELWVQPQTLLRDRRTEKETDTHTLTGSLCGFISMCTGHVYMYSAYVCTQPAYTPIMCVLPSAAGLGYQCGRQYCFQGACHPRRRPWQQQSLSSCR